jgi:hypothetical protein
VGSPLRRPAYRCRSGTDGHDDVVLLVDELLDVLLVVRDVLGDDRDRFRRADRTCAFLDTLPENSLNDLSSSWPMSVTIPIFSELPVPGMTPQAAKTSATAT